MKVTLKPGKGWRHLGGPVWEHINGTRIHSIGLIRFPDMSFKNSNKLPEAYEIDRFIRINGGNRKRGLMAYSLHANS